MRPAVQRDDPRFVNHLLVDDHVVRRLEDLDVAVVAAGQHGRTLLRADDAALRQGAVLRAGGDLHGRQQVAPPLLARGRQGGHPAVRRIDHQRRLPRPGHLGAALVPDLVEAADGYRRRRRGGFGRAGNVAGRLQLALRHVVLEGALLPPVAGRRLLYLRHLFLRQRGAIGELRGAFQRRQRLERPDALQVGMAELGPQGHVAAGRRRLGPVGGGSATQRRNGDDSRGDRQAPARPCRRLTIGIHHCRPFGSRAQRGHSWFCGAFATSRRRARDSPSTPSVVSAPSDASSSAVSG